MWRRKKKINEKPSTALCKKEFKKKKKPDDEKLNKRAKPGVINPIKGHAVCILKQNGRVSGE